jgi:RimJ/RimL family protein N-acetyltransferase
VVLFTQTANARSMRLAAKLGFTEVERFEAYGAKQWFGMWSPVTPSDRARAHRPSAACQPNPQSRRTA